MPRPILSWRDGEMYIKLLDRKRSGKPLTLLMQERMDKLTALINARKLTGKYYMFGAGSTLPDRPIIVTHRVPKKKKHTPRQLAVKGAIRASIAKDDPAYPAFIADYELKIRRQRHARIVKEKGFVDKEFIKADFEKTEAIRTGRLAKAKEARNAAGKVADAAAGVVKDIPVLGAVAKAAANVVNAVAAPLAGVVGAITGTSAEPKSTKWVTASKPPPGWVGGTKAEGEIPWKG